LIAATLLNDMLLGGIKAEIEGFKQEVKKRLGYTDQGKLKKNLGIWYEEFNNKNGEPFLVATQNNLIHGIIYLYEKHT
jgi:hypothetical protein